MEWELRDAVISNERGEKVFEQKNCEIPKSWTQLATNVVVSKYFRGHVGTPEREHSVRQLIGRVADTIANWGRRMDYFATEADAQTFQDELTPHSAAPESRLQLSCLVQRRTERSAGSAVQRVFYQQRG